MAKEKMVVDQGDFSQDDIQAGLRLLAQKRATDARRRERIEKGEIPAGTSYKDLPPEVKAKYQERDRRYATRMKLTIRKAKEAGITVSEAEIDAELAKK
jgi:hypothetical protein